MAVRADDKGLYKRGRRWWLRLYVPGEGKKRLPLVPRGEKNATTDKNVARAIARQIRQKIANRTNGAPSVVGDDGDLAALLDQFQVVNAIGIRSKQARDNVSCVRRLIQRQGIQDASQITVGATQDHLAHLAQAGMQPKTLRNHLAAISGFCRFLMERGHLDANPCRLIRTPKIEKLPPRFLSDKDRRQVLQLAREHGSSAEVATALYTGLRREELRQLAWADVDFERRVIIIPKSKSRRPRQIPMSKKAEAVFRRQRKRTGDRKYVFPGKEQEGCSGMRSRLWWLHALRPIQKAVPIFLELKGTRVGRGWHLFRQTFASRLVQAGVPIAKVSAWLGHSDIRTTMMYAHLAPGHDEDIEKA